MYVDDWTKIVSHELSCLKQWRKFTMISASCLLSCSTAAKENYKVESTNALLEKAIKVN